MSKETSTTLDAEKVPFKLKISSKDSTGGSKAGSTAGSRRSSPRKKIGKTASPRAGSVSGASDSQVVAKRNHLAKAAESHGRRNLRGKPESGGGMKGSSLGVKNQGCIKFSATFCPTPVFLILILFLKFLSPFFFLHLIFFPTA